jgi:predicted small lipoprotein YifL
MHSPQSVTRSLRPRLLLIAAALAGLSLGVSCATKKPAELPPPPPAPEWAATERVVREPVFRITSIRVMRDLLVTTELRLGLEVENPNDFPLALDSFSWRFWAEGRPWASGEAPGSACGAAGPLLIPARGKAERRLDFEMNFADRDRRLFDLVARLSSVSYRLFGEARLSTPEAGIPAFGSRFDESGSCPVER